METQNIITQEFKGLLQALWSAEKQLTEAMPAMIEKSAHLGLTKNLAMHLAETDQHKVAIEAICKTLGFEHEGEENEEMKALLAQGQQKLAGVSPGDEGDAVIIEGAIQIEHYEIEQYTTAGDMAEAMGYEGIARRLRLTLEEERQADAKLNYLDKSFIQKSSVLGAPGLALK